MTDGKPEKKMVNPDLRKGDAQAQWSESDLNFFDTKGKMVGSQGQIIDLGTEGDKGQQQQNKSFKATTTTTEQREGKWMMEMMSTGTSAATSRLLTVCDFRICSNSDRGRVHYV